MEADHEVARGLFAECTKVTILQSFVVTKNRMIHLAHERACLEALLTETAQA
jgi:hypothetical protein